MAFEKLTPDTLKGGDHYISVTQTMVGFKWVDIWANNVDKIGNLEWFLEPWEVSKYAYPSEVYACVDAYELAEALDIPYALNYVPGMPEFDEAKKQMIASDFIAGCNKQQ
jgi:hypothetical protein